MVLYSSVTSARIHPFRSIINVLQCICKSCSRILLKPEVAASYREKIKAKELPYLSKKNVRKKLVELCKKVSTCHHCGQLNGVVKKCGLLKISHEKFRNQKKTSEVVLKKLAEYDDVIENNKELQSMLASGLIHILNPLEVLNLFEHIPDEDIPLLLMDKDAARPSFMILQVRSTKHRISS